MSGIQKAMYQAETKLVKALFETVKKTAGKTKSYIPQETVSKLGQIGTEVVNVTKDKFGRKVLTTQLNRSGQWPLMSEIILQKNGGAIIKGNGITSVVDKNGRVIKEGLKYTDKIYMPNGTVILLGHGSKKNVCAEVYGKNVPKGVGIRTGAVKDGKTYSVLTDFDDRNHVLLVSDSKGNFLSSNVLAEGHIPYTYEIPIPNKEVTLNIVEPPAPYSADVLRHIVKEIGPQKG